MFIILHFDSRRRLSQYTTVIADPLDPLEIMVLTDLMALQDPKDLRATTGLQETPARPDLQEDLQVRQEPQEIPVRLEKWGLPVIPDPQVLLVVSSVKDGI
jgi:hypothetical protein